MNLTGKLLIAAAAVTGLTGAASAADLYVPPPAPPAAIAAPVASGWDGLYLGVFAGYAQGNDDVNVTSPVIPAPTSFSYDYSGYMVGIQGGYNFHLSDAIVAGISADLAYNNASGSGAVTSVPGVTGTTALNWTGSITGRAGVDLNGVVPYILGGVAFANVEGSDTYSNASDTQTLTGYTVGAGVEFMLADNLSANVEYRYSDYGTHDFTDVGSVNTASYSAHPTDNSVRVGLNYHF